MDKIEKAVVHRVLKSVSGLFETDGNWKVTDLDGVGELAKLTDFEFPEGADEVDDENECEGE